LTRCAPVATACSAWVGDSGIISGRLSRSGVAPIGAALVVLMLAGCGGRSHARPVPPTAPATKVVSVTPETATDTLKPAYYVGFHRAGVTCEDRSDVLPGDYRCGGRLGVFDPCWADATTTLPAVSCLFEPWSHEVFRLVLNQPLAAPDPGGAVYVWGMQLSSGQRCLAFQGAHSSFDGQPVNYYCPSDPALSLVGRPDARQSAWRIRELYTDPQGHQRFGPRVAIAIAWFGLPSPLPPSAGATSATSATQPAVGVS
jgi:hypothetical protein